MRSNLLFLPALLLTAGLLSGCIYSREISHTRRDIERQYPQAQLKREVVLNLGPVSMRMARWFSGLVKDEEMQTARSYLKEISRAKIGVFEVEAMPDLSEIDLSRLDRMRRNGWELAVKMREEDEVVWVMYKERKGTVRDLYVFVLDDEELVVARIKGRLDKLIARVMEDHLNVSELTLAD